MSISICTFATQVCEQCTDEFCDETCLVFQYDSYQVKYIDVKGLLIHFY